MVTSAHDEAADLRGDRHGPPRTYPAGRVPARGEDPVVSGDRRFVPGEHAHRAASGPGPAGIRRGDGLPGARGVRQQDLSRRPGGAGAASVPTRTWALTLVVDRFPSHA